MEKAVFKATRKDLVHPKLKHVRALIQMTWTGASPQELFMLLQDRFGEAHWVIALKGLIVVHILMQDGNGPLIYDYLARDPHALDMERFRDRQGTRSIEQTKNVRSYASYLNDRMLAFKSTRIDYMARRSTAGSQIYAPKITDTKFLLLEVSTVQKLLHSLFKSRFDTDTIDNETTFSAFRYMLRDALKLFQTMNEGVMKMLKLYFNMDDADMRRSLDLYKRFIRLTERMDEFLAAARRFEGAPISLAKDLADYLALPKGERKKALTDIKSQSEDASKASKPQDSSKENAPQEKESNIIDFFASLDDEPPQPAMAAGMATATTQNALLDNTFQALGNPFEVANSQANINALLQQQQQQQIYNNLGNSLMQTNIMQSQQQPTSQPLFQPQPSQLPLSAADPFVTVSPFGSAPNASSSVTPLDSNPFRASMMPPSDFNIFGGAASMQAGAATALQENRLSYNPFAQTTTASMPVSSAAIAATTTNTSVGFSVFGDPSNSSAVAAQTSLPLQNQAINVDNPFNVGLQRAQSSSHNLPAQSAPSAAAAVQPVIGGSGGIDWTQSTVPASSMDPFADFGLGALQSKGVISAGPAGTQQAALATKANGNFADFNVFHQQ
ncbi:hypothetical protein EV182_001507 [Spiromyces aspiralis]|uniref:Uncharacterized protein n=1 Tax=Spiromyces aspiralis TaxID=68401 RepID=A0ACC1HX69_9FUNG|nr:hypothetical protein EV182_001507 [Spiromyces aspiralis]